tara:strand:+ start:272 stop:508 length:237 start_codon:yes stop_codon:yes gene_type:complete
MIDKSTILTIVTIIGTFLFNLGITSNKMESFEKEHNKSVKRVKVNEDSIVDLKIGVAKIETQLDNRFDKLEEILMDLE